MAGTPTDEAGIDTDIGSFSVSMVVGVLVSRVATTSDSKLVAVAAITWESLGVAAVEAAAVHCILVDKAVVNVVVVSVVGLEGCAEVEVEAEAEEEAGEAVFVEAASDDV